jgi:predicted hydrocarbon binding protein
MLQFVTKLLMSQQLKFEKGIMTIFGERVLIFPLDMVKLVIEKSLKDEKFANSIYDAAKESVIAFSGKVSNRLNIKKPKDMLDMLINLTEMNGYGEIQPVKIDYDTNFAVFHLRGLPSESLFGKVKGAKTADVYWAGLVAGGLTYVFGKDIDCAETRCAINGKQSCEIIGAEKKQLLKYLKENKIEKPSYL